ncbi:hypothetical protein QBC43DRAFT_85670 [Cladorrhinum sp. PSN259]|nr:hypothetical protein QBC43DRAFT_85670 [Cladorrhinum sp. PSN259]
MESGKPAHHNKETIAHAHSATTETSTCRGQCPASAKNQAEEAHLTADKTVRPAARVLPPCAILPTKSLPSLVRTTSQKYEALCLHNHCLGACELGRASVSMLLPDASYPSPNPRQGGAACRQHIFRANAKKAPTRVTPTKEYEVTELLLRLIEIGLNYRPSLGNKGAPSAALESFNKGISVTGRQAGSGLLISINTIKFETNKKTRLPTRVKGYPLRCHRLLLNMTRKCPRSF